jgi:transposase
MLLRTLLAYLRGAPRACAMVSAPTPEDEDRRRVSRERKALTNERIRHVNRIKGLLFGQGITGYEPLRRDRRKQLDELVTGDGRPLPDCLKAQIGRELDRIELLLAQIKRSKRSGTLCSQQRHPRPRRRQRSGADGRGLGVAAFHPSHAHRAEGNRA